jgi:hypothetical protein
MTWAIKDEWIDLAQARHVVVLHNPDVMVEDGKTGQMKPVEHHLINEFKLAACPHCGHLKPAKQSLTGTVDSVLKTAVDEEPPDFHEIKRRVLAGLQDHHQQLLRYREQHPRVRIGSGPKK